MFENVFITTDMATNKKKVVSLEGINRRRIFYSFILIHIIEAKSILAPFLYYLKIFVFGRYTAYHISYLNLVISFEKTYAQTKPTK